MFIIDFDDTLFNTHIFKFARRDAIVKIGVSEQTFWDTYAEARNGVDGIFHYSDERHAEALALHGIDYGVAVGSLRAVTTRAEDFIFSGATSLLSTIKAKGHELVLLSLGDPEFQKIKVDGSKITSFFDRIIMVQDTKANVLGNILKNLSSPEVGFINVKPLELFEVFILVT